jgi:hypothetical protein
MSFFNKFKYYCKSNFKCKCNCKSKTATREATVFLQKLNRKNLGEQLLTLVNAFVNFALLRPSWSRFGVWMTGFPKIPPSRPPSSAEVIEYRKL